MDKNSTRFLNQLAGFKIRIKELHWNAKVTAEHELCDKITDKINDMQDKTAEELQTLYGKIRPGETNPIMPKAATTKSFIAELLTAIQEYYEYTKKEEKFVGIRANMESYISDVNIFDYLADMAVRESKNGHNVIVTEAQMRKATADKIHEEMKAGANDDVTGVFEFGNNSVYINESNSMIAVKDGNKNVIFEQQGNNVRNLLNLMKTQGKMIESKGGFKTVLAGWLEANKII